jgi:hypothetical protein
MLTSKDNKILEFVNEYGGITIQQAHKLFFNTKYGYDTARRRLKLLEEAEFIKVSRDFVTDLKIYYTHKKPSSHSIILLNFYCELISKGAEVILFQREFKVIGARADALIIYKINGLGKIILVEVDLQHKTKISKYDKCFESKYFQQKYNTFPLIVIIEQRQRAEKREEKKYRVIRIGYGYNNIERVLL